MNNSDLHDDVDPRDEVNYWPAHKYMYWPRDESRGSDDSEEIESDD